MSDSDRSDFIALYKGRPANTLTHAELLDAYTHICRLYTEMRQCQIKANELQMLFDAARLLR